MYHTTRQARLALPLTAALLMMLLCPAALALFGGGSKPVRAAPGAPIARNLEYKAYRGVACTGTLQATDNEGEAVTFQIVEPPVKGTLECGAEGVFVYTPNADASGADHFTYTATDESGAVSVPATVTIRVSRTASGVRYADTNGLDCATAAVDLAEHGVFIGARMGDEWFFEPERTVSRGAFVAMALAAAGVAPSDVTVTGFADDAAIPTWAKGSVAGALAAGVVQGARTEQGVVFRAENDITLSEAAAVLDRVLDVTDVSLPDPGADEPEWYAQAVANLESVRVAPVGGFGEGLDRAVTRGEAASLLSAAITLREAREAEASVWSRLF